MARVLVVDDEPHIVLLASAVLRRAGHETIEATSGAKALELWRAEIDLLLTDWVMPDLFGYELARRLTDRKPSLRVVYMSGNPIGSMQASVRLEENINFLQKPFDSESLSSTVERALCAPSAIPA